MTFLSDRDILAEINQGNITCTPFIRENLSNSSIDLRLGGKLKKITPRDHSAYAGYLIDPETGKLEAQKNNCEIDEFDLTTDPYFLLPGQFVLGSTLEYVGSNASHILGQISDKSTIARDGGSTYFGAGYIDPENPLNITLEIKNNGHVPIELQHGMHICQIRFAYLSSPVMESYNGKYLNSRTVEGAK